MVPGGFCISRSDLSWGVEEGVWAVCMCKRARMRARAGEDFLQMPLGQCRLCLCDIGGKSLNLSESQKIVVKVKRASLNQVSCRL